MIKHQNLCCRLYILISKSQICALGLGPSLQILFSYQAALDEFQLSHVLQEQSLTYSKNLSSISVMVSVVHIAISHIELEEQLTEKDLLAYIKLEQAQLFPRLGKDIYFDFSVRSSEGKQHVNIFAIDKEQLCYWLFKEDIPLNLTYVGIDKIIENSSYDLMGAAALSSVSEILSKDTQDNFPDDFLIKINTSPQFYNLHQDLQRLPQDFWPLLYLVVKECWR